MHKEEKKKSKDELKKEIENIDNKITEENARLKKLNEAHESLVALKDNLDVCTTIFSKSLDRASRGRFDNLVLDNDTSFRKTCSDFQSQADFIKNNINKLRNQRDVILHEYDNSSFEEDEEQKKKEE